MRKPHYWRKPVSRPTPTEVVVVDTETWHGEYAETFGGELQSLRLGCALAYRYERGKRSRVAELDFTNADAFWRFLESRLSRQRTTWIVGHNLAYDLGALNGWRWFTQSPVTIEKAVIDNGILYVTGFHADRKFIVVDTFNWYKCGLAAIAKANGIPKLEMPRQEDDDYDWFAYCRRDVDATAAGLDSLVSFVRERELGPFQPTIASLAFSIYRHRFMTEKTLVHSVRPALDLERQAYYGGIVDTPFVGRPIVGPVHECDVVSMYPHVCRSDLPTVFRGLLSRPTVRDVETRLRHYAVIAEVVLRSDAETYPVRRRHNVYHVTGEFRTVLADAEFRRAWASGSVKEVKRICWYRKAPIFAEFMEYFMAEKSRARVAGNESDEVIAKFTGNSLYGKTAQLTPRWLTWDSYAMTELEQWYGLTPGSLEYRSGSPPLMDVPEKDVCIPHLRITLHCRQYWGDVEVACGRAESRDSVPSIAACVTSAARVQLRSYQRTAGPRHYFYSDTDSVWVDDVGLQRLRDTGAIGSGELGTLDVKRTVPTLTVHGRKDYTYPNGRKTKGRKKSAQDLTPDEFRRRWENLHPGMIAPDPDGRETFSQLHFPTAKTQLADGPWNGVYVREAIKILRRNVDWCKVAADGWTQPFHLPTDEPLIGEPRPIT